MKRFYWIALLCLIPLLSLAQGRRLEMLFLGDQGHHKPFDRYPALQQAIGVKGINITYTNSLKDLNPAYLSQFDGLILYANHDSIAAPQAKALLDFVAQGKGLVALHCASFCFRNSPELVNLMGGQFWRHRMDSIRVENALPQHPVLKDYKEIKTVDETYLHTKLASDNIVLQYRFIGADQAKDKPGQTKEPYTWVRSHGKGHVFYTAYGHDERTWGSEAFQHLVYQGILWAVGPEKRELLARLELPTLRYREAALPNYEKREGPQLQQLPLSPSDSKKFIQVPVGFELSIFASEPDVMHPIAMAWDEKGRLYVLITKDYPNERKPNGGSDYILRCEDSNGDGKADRFTRFADGLSIPTGMVFAQGGLIVSQAPDMVFLKDTDGDGKADERKVLFTGFGTGDTHAGPSNLNYGFDNWIYACVGYSGFKGKVGQDSLNFAQAFFRFKPDGSQMEHLTTTSNNTWGFAFNEAGDVFGSTANNAHGWYMAIPHRNLWKAPFTINGGKSTDTHKDMRTITPKVRQVDVFGGYTAASGHQFYTARAFPKHYWNQIAFVNEPTGHVVHQNRMRRQGSDYSDEEAFNLLAGADEWVSPVFAQVGPDGAVWIADWYSFIIQHNPTPVGFKNGTGNAYETDLRDYTHGRIYRVAWKKAPSYQPIALDVQDPKACLTALSHSNLFWRLQAQRLLVERGKLDVVPALIALLKDKKVDELGLNVGAIHALRTLQGLNALDRPDVRPWVQAALQHPSPALRRNALQAMPRNERSAKALLAANLWNDKDTLVQLHAVLAAMEMPNQPALTAALNQKYQAYKTGSDRWLSDALAAWKMQRGEAAMREFIVAKGKEPIKLAADALGKDLNNNAIAGSTEGLDLVVEDIQVLGTGAFKLREGNAFVIKIKNRGSQALEKGKTLPLNVSIVGQGRRLDMESFTFTEGVPAGATVSVTKLSNGPWTGNFSWTPEAIGTYVMEVQIDKKAQLGERNLQNNVLRRQYQVQAQYDLEAYTIERYYRGLAVSLSASELLTWIKQIEDPSSVAMASAIKGISATWNVRKAANLNADERAWLQALSERLPLAMAPAYQRLAEVWKLPIPSEANETIVRIQIKTIKEAMKFDLTQFKVPAGAQVELILENPDAMQHNLVIGQMGSMEKIGKAADQMITQKDAAALNYVPQIPEVMAYTPLVDPDGRARLRFKAPSQKGAYPYVCTFPGHWRIMNGTMLVE